MDVKRCLTIVASILLLAGSAANAANTEPPAGEVTLPLKDYLGLVETAERTERQRAEELARQEAAVAEVVSQRVSVEIRGSGGSDATVTSDFEVLLQGKSLRPVLLPVAGFPERIEIRDEAGRTGTASATAVDGGGGIVLAAMQPGRYTVHVDGRAALGNASGTGRLHLGRVAAPVASTEVDLPAELAWSSPGAVVVEEREQAGRRRVRLATNRGADTVLDIRRKVDSAEAEKLLAQSVVLTIVQLRPEGVRRHDVVLYEVRRGSLGRFTVELPPGLEIDQAGTDEGTVAPVVEGGRLTVHRKRQLQGTGYLVLTSTPPALPAEGLALDMVRPEPEVRARYLALSSAVAADVRPLPDASWTRVDLSDLPGMLSEAMSALDLSAAWRLSETGASTRLAVAPLPSAPTLDGTIHRRDTTTLLTVDGTLLFRDVFTVESRSRGGAALDVVLPAGATLWSVKVDGQPVRPLERGGTISVPLGFDSGVRVRVEVVSVQDRALPPGRSQLALALPRVTAPVLVHEVRLLLPESSSYRFRRGDLRLVPILAARAEPWSVLQKAPGVLTDRINVGGNESGQQPASGSEPLPADVEDVVTVTAESPLLDERRISTGATVEQRELDKIPSARHSFDAFQQEVDGLRLVAGVKPLPVSIPESGKAFRFSGVLPPSNVTLEIDVKAGKGKR